MLGNVFAWTEDCAHGNYNGAPPDGAAWIEGGNCRSRVVRGGSWNNNPQNLRAAYRNWLTPGNRNNNRGFRVGRTLTP